MPKISCIVLACDSHVDKGNSVLFSIHSLLRQAYDEYEIIIVENSHDKGNVTDLSQYVKKWIVNLGKKIDVRFISNDESLSYGEARNVGAKVARGEILVFVDDDTILLNTDALSQVEKFAHQYAFGFGAKRLWTKGKEFQRQSGALLKEIDQTNIYSRIRAMVGPPPLGRCEKSEDSIFLKRTFISNFGFCKKKDFDDVQGFIDFPGYGFEDDHLAFKLYKSGLKFKRLNQVCVIHVNHSIRKGQVDNLPYYFEELVKSGYFWFNIVELLQRDTVDKRKILIPLRDVHYDERVIKAYNFYKRQIPLNGTELSSQDLKSWKRDIRYELHDFVLVLNELFQAKTLDEFVKRSKSDFDNLGMVVWSAKMEGLLDIAKTGAIIPQIDFKYLSLTGDVDVPSIDPNVQFNQFPCDRFSRKRRSKFIKSRYPFCDFLRLGIIGDDDFLSLEFANDYWVYPVVLEKDERILQRIREVSKYISVHQADFQASQDVGDIPKVQTFITDPPYTLHGALCFIKVGLQIMGGEGSEFYVILNPTMMGKNMLELQKILTSCGILLADVITDFSQYKLPIGYGERVRADSLMSKMNVSGEFLKYSSSSSLYVFRCVEVDVDKLASQIDKEKMYNHYL